MSDATASGGSPPPPPDAAAAAEAAEAAANVPQQMAWLQALREPELALRWSLPQWERRLRLARRLRLLGRLAESIVGADLLARLPPPVQPHLVAEWRYARWRGQAMAWVLTRVGDAWAGLPGPRVLLKGAAYLGQGLALARGRLPSDVDVLVPRTGLAQARQRLVERGWQETAMDDHDQRYYREWSHELPPMQHPVHLLELDVHHDILPPVARVHVDMDLLLADARPACALPGWHVLSPADQVLHAAAHLFHDSDLSDRLRDLVDIDQLLRDLTTDPAAWNRLLDRARQLGLAQSLALAMLLCRRWLGTPIPQATLIQAQRQGLPGLQRWWLPALMAAALHPTDPDREPGWTQRWAARLVLVRHHLGRMPMRLLLPHLLHKLRDPAGAATARPPAAG